MSAGLIETRTTGTWTIDPAHSDVGFVIRHLMISNIKGHFTKFEGQRRLLRRGQVPHDALSVHRRQA